MQALAAQRDQASLDRISYWDSGAPPYRWIQRSVKYMQDHGVAGNRAGRLLALLTTAMYDAGFGSSSRLYERAGAALGMTPATYRKGAPGVDIDFTIAPSPLGRLLLAATERGVCRVMIGDSESDVLAGQNAGTLTCVVTFGYRSAGQLLETKPDVMVDRFEQLKDVIE